MTAQVGEESLSALEGCNLQLDEVARGIRRGRKSAGATKPNAHKLKVSHHEIIIGVDPGLSATGYAVIQSNGRTIRLIEGGVIVSSQKKSLHDRLAELFEGISEVLKEHSPNVAVLERLFCKRRRERSALMLGHARGAICAAMASHGLPIAEYTFTSAKRTIVGKGNATKKQLHNALRRLIDFNEVESKRLCEHAMDALALAICHALSQPVEIQATCKWERLENADDEGDGKPIESNLCKRG